MEEYVNEIATKLSFGGKLDNRISYVEAKKIIENVLTNYVLKRNEELLDLSKYFLDQDISSEDMITHEEIVSDFLKNKDNEI